MSNSKVWVKQQRARQPNNYTIRLRKQEINTFKKQSPMYNLYIQTWPREVRESYMPDTPSADLAVDTKTWKAVMADWIQKINLLEQEQLPIVQTESDNDPTNADDAYDEYLQNANNYYYQYARDAAAADAKLVNADTFDTDLFDKNDLQHSPQPDYIPAPPLPRDPKNPNNIDVAVLLRMATVFEPNAR